jgi:hypothetical protein
VFRHVLGRTDVERWSRIENILPEWDDRNRALGAAIPAGSSVLEFGCGRGTLERYLDRPRAYVGSDIVARQPSTLVVDLNRRPLPDVSSLDADTAVFSGVLEYVFDVPAVLRWLPAAIARCYASYVVADGDRLRERLRRVRVGWVNSFGRDELVALFGSAGFALVDEVPWNESAIQPIFVFDRSQRIGGA